MINNSLLVNMMVVKNTTFEVIKNSLLINTMEVQNKSPLNWYQTLSWKKKEKTIFFQWDDKYDQWDNNPYTPVEGNEIGGSHTFNVEHSVFDLTKTKHNRKSKARIVSKASTSHNKPGVYINKC